MIYKASSLITSLNIVYVIVFLFLLVVVSFITDFDWKYFWAWTDFQSYVDFLLIVSLVMSLLTFLLLDSVIYIEILGFLALFIEAMLAVPQLIRNFKQKSTEGMR